MLPPDAVPIRRKQLPPDAIPINELPSDAMSISAMPRNRPSILKTAIQTATDPILQTYGLDSTSRKMQDLYSRGREGLLESEPFQKMRAGLPNESSNLRIPFSMKLQNPVTAAGMQVGAKVPLREIAKQAQGLGIDVVGGLGTDLALAKGPAILSKGLMKPISKGLEETAGRLINFYIKPRAAGYKFGGNPGRAVAKYIGPTMTKEGLHEKIILKKDELLNSLENAVKSAQESGQKVDATPIFEEISGVVKKMKGFPRTYDSQINAHMDLAKDIFMMTQKSGRVEGGRLYVSPVDAVKIKRAIGDLPSWAINDPKLGTLTKTARKAYGKLDRSIDKAVPKAKELNRDVSDLIGAEKGIELGMQREQNKYPLGLMDIGFGALFGHQGGPMGMLQAAVVSKAARSAPAITTAGAVAGGAARAGRRVGGFLESTKRPSIMEEVFKSLKGREKDGLPIITPQEPVIPKPRQITRNRASEVSRQLPTGISSGKPQINVEGSSTINMPEILESDFKRMAEKFGIETYAPPRSRTTEFPKIPRRSIPERLMKLLRRRGIE